MLKTSIYLLLFCFITIISFPSCSDTSSQKPENFIEKERMVAIITEIQLAEAAIALMPLSHVQAMTRFKKYESDIFKKYKTDSAAYFGSYQYYSSQGKNMQYMYLIVSDSINAQKIRAEKLARIDSAIMDKRKDSLRIVVADSIKKVNDALALKKGKNKKF
jgi:hypothetical protein